MRVVIETCDNNDSEVRIYEDEDGVNPPRCLQILVRGFGRRGLGFHINGGTGMDADESDLLPNIYIGTVG